MRLWTVAAVVAVSAIALVCAASGFSRTSALAAQKAVMHSTVFEWKDQDAKPNAWGAVRQVTRSATPTLDELEIHISTLNPGQSPHAPHQHAHEELLIVKQGTLETFQSGETRRVGPGGIIFQASNEQHNVKNVGDTPAVYYVIGWTPPGVK
jgi:quercetin dioxygenase-like cupin family protein